MTATTNTKGQFVYVDSDVPAGMTLAEWRRRDMVDVKVAHRHTVADRLHGLRRRRRHGRPALAFA
jgi:hypothetical protein